MNHGPIALGTVQWASDMGLIRPESARHRDAPGILPLAWAAAATVSVGLWVSIAATVSSLAA